MAEIEFPTYYKFGVVISFATLLLTGTDLLTAFFLSWLIAVLTAILLMFATVCLMLLILWLNAVVGIVSAIASTLHRPDSKVH
ncbi:MAG: hypothetical protein ABW146_08650 [Candidatus Sedimenticola sp. 6PFRAG7]